METKPFDMWEYLDTPVRIDAYIKLQEIEIGKLRQEISQLKMQLGDALSDKNLHG